MPATHTVQLGSGAAARLVTVKELTVGEVRDWLVKTQNDTSGDPLHALALDECNLADLSEMCDIEVQDLEAYAPSDLAELIATCKSLNPHFFRLRAALASVARAIKAEVGAMASTAPPASS